MRYRLRTLLIFLAIGPPVLTCAGSALADNENDPTGTWTWSSVNPELATVLSVTLKLDGGTLTGSMKLSQSGREWPIEDGTFKDGVVTFNRKYVTANGGKMISTFTGKMTENVIKGKTDYTRNGKHLLSQIWEAKRVSNP